MESYLFFVRSISFLLPIGFYGSSALAPRTSPKNRIKGMTYQWKVEHLNLLHSLTLCSFIPHTSLSIRKETTLIECGKLLQRSEPKIKRINTINFKKSMKYNPFGYIYDKKNILKLVNTLIANIKGSSNMAKGVFYIAGSLLHKQQKDTLSLRIPAMWERSQYFLINLLTFGVHNIIL